MEEYRETPWEWLSGWIAAIYWRIKQWLQSKMKRKLIITTLDKRYCDRDTILLHAAFQILVNYWEKEKPKEHHYFEHSDYVLESLYFWWKTFRPQRIDPYDSKYFENVPEPSFEEMWIPCEDRPGFREFVIDEEKYGQYWNTLSMAGDIEEQHAREDEEKLILLAQNFRAMWI